MATASLKKQEPVEYPTSDGKPMAETDFHRDLMVNTIKRLDYWYADVPDVYVTGNLLLYYVRGNKRKHISPDVFVVRGVSKEKRLYYLTWEEGKTPDAVVEITSSSTKKEDKDKKFQLYRDVLKVKEYFLFDPFGEHLDPPLQGFRLHRGDYVPIRPVDGRLPSKVIGLHLERYGEDLLLFDPVSGQHIPTPDERAEEAKQRADEAIHRADEETRRADEETRRADEETRRADEETRRAEEAERGNVALAEEIARLRMENQRLLQPKQDRKNGT